MVTSAQKCPPFLRHYVRNKALRFVLLYENNQQQGGVVTLTYCCHVEVDYFSITAHHKVCYSSYTTAIYQ